MYSYTCSNTSMQILTDTHVCTIICLKTYISLRKTKTGYIRIINLFPSCHRF